MGDYRKPFEELLDYSGHEKFDPDQLFGVVGEKGSPGSRGGLARLSGHRAKNCLFRDLVAKFWQSPHISEGLPKSRLDWAI